MEGDAEGFKDATRVAEGVAEVEDVTNQAVVMEDTIAIPMAIVHTIVEIVRPRFLPTTTLQHFSTHWEVHRIIDIDQKGTRIINVETIK